MHHVPYTHVLHSGKTVIQHIYDSHYQGAQDAAGFVTRWQPLEAADRPRALRAVLAKLEYQAGHAIVWRDAVSSWFLKVRASRTRRAGPDTFRDASRPSRCASTATP